MAKKSLTSVFNAELGRNLNIESSMCEIVNNAWLRDHPDEGDNIVHRQVPITEAVQNALKPLKDHMDALPDIAGQTARKVYDVLKDDPSFQPNKRKKRQREIEKVIAEEREKFKKDIERNVRQRLNLPDSHELFVFDDSFF